MKDGAAAGDVSSGGYAHNFDCSMPMGYVATGHWVPGSQLEVEILEEMYCAEVKCIALRYRDTHFNILRGAVASLNRQNTIAGETEKNPLTFPRLRHVYGMYA